MGKDDGVDPRDDVTGLPIEDAVEVVVERGDADDQETARAVLERVSEDGVVGRAGVNAALGHVSKVVSTPETRVELAEGALEEAREAAAPVEDRPIVRTRLEGYEARLEDVRTRVDGLSHDLRHLVGLRGDPGRIYDLALGVRQLTESANGCQRAADELATDVEAFERWLSDPAVRYRDVAGDLEALDESLDDLAGTVDGLAAAVDGEGSEVADADDAVATWLDASLERRVLGLVLADLRWELDELERWAAEEDVEVGDGAAIGSRLDELDARRESFGDRLDELERPGWRDRFGEWFASVEADLDEVEPPVDWGSVRTTLDSHRARLEGAE